MRLKQRARMLAAGVALSAATLALIPGVAAATTDPTDCVCRAVGGITDTGNSTQEPSDAPDNSAKLVGLQDTSAANGAELLDDNVSGNSVSVSAPIESDGSGSTFEGDASSTDNTDNGGVSPSDDEQNSAGIAGAQDTSVLNGSEIGNDNASGNSTGVSAPVLSDDSGSQFDNDASSTSSGGSGNANSPSGEKQNDADVAGLQDTSVLNGSEIGNDNASGNSTGVSAPIASDNSGSQFDNDASSTNNTGNGGTNNGGTNNGGTDNGGTDNGGTDNGGTNDSGKKPNSGQGNGDEAGDPGNSQPNNNGGDDGSPNGGQSAKR